MKQSKKLWKSCALRGGRLACVCVLLASVLAVLCACGSTTTGGTQGAAASAAASAPPSETTLAATDAPSGAIGQSPATTDAGNDTLEGAAASTLAPDTPATATAPNSTPLSATKPAAGLTTPMPQTGSAAAPAETQLDAALLGTWKQDLNADSWISWTFDQDGKMQLKQVQMGSTFAPETYTYTTQDGQVFLTNEQGDAATRWYVVEGNTLRLYLAQGEKPELTLTKQ